MLIDAKVVSSIVQLLGGLQIATWRLALQAKARVLLQGSARLSLHAAGSLISFAHRSRVRVTDLKRHAHARSRAPN